MLFCRRIFNRWLRLRCSFELFQLCFFSLKLFEPRLRNRDRVLCNGKRRATKQNQEKGDTNSDHKIKHYQSGRVMANKSGNYRNELCRASTWRTSAAPLRSMALLSMIVREFGPSVTWPSLRTTCLIFEPVNATSRFGSAVVFFLTVTVVEAFAPLVSLVSLSEASAAEDANAR